MEDQINDCFLGAIGRRPTVREIHYIVTNLPEKIEFLAEQWGWYDTEVGDMTVKWIRENQEKIII